MKLGTIKYVDCNGRVHIPLAIREKLKIQIEDDVNVFEENGRIIIEKINYDREGK
jgi:AbrB family looped-hinge helix DNA binding protein